MIRNGIKTPFMALSKLSLEKVDAPRCVFVKYGMVLHEECLTGKKKNALKFFCFIDTERKFQTPGKELRNNF